MHTQKIIKILREEYHRRLIETMDEADVFDEKGELILTKDLKVRHKDTQFEYTVDDVFNEPGTDKIKIALKLPDEPRFEPPGEEGIITDKGSAELMEEEELITGFEDIEDLSDDLIFVVDQEEFEKEYEVK